ASRRSGSARIRSRLNTIVPPPVVYAGDEITIQGSGFSRDPAEREVRVVAADNLVSTAQVVASSAEELRVRVPFGAGSGNVSVRLGANESRSLTPLRLGTSVSGFVQEAVRQSDGS
ncbi:MAG: IPT/TIG domain-containing protein, partial [Candidatus Methylomirabilis sp.]